MGWDTQNPTGIAQASVVANGAVLRAGTDTENDAYTGKEGEQTFDITTPNVRIHDGSTVGGLALTPGVTFSAVTRTINAQTGTAYTLVLTDAGDIVTMSNASANELTIPTNASVAFAVGDQVDLSQLGAGVTSVTGDTGVTVNGVSAGTGALNAQYASVTLVKLATNTWLMTGSHGTVA